MFRTETFAKGVTNEFKFEIEETLRDPMNPEVMFARGVTSELRFETADTLREPANSEATLRVETFAKSPLNWL